MSTESEKKSLRFPSDKVLVAVRDCKAEIFNGLTVCRNTAVAERLFSDLFKPNSEFAAHPEDYELHMLAIFNEDSGYLEYAPRLIVRGVDVYHKEM